MDGEGSTMRRIRFYGPTDLAMPLQRGRAIEIVERFDPEALPTHAADLIELHNVQQFVEAGLFPTEYTDAQRARAKAHASAIRSIVARGFANINNINIRERIAGVDHDYHADLLELLARSGAFERCDSAAMLSALNATGVKLRTMLANKRLVRAYDTQLRDMLVSDVRNAEHLIRKHFHGDYINEIYLPGTLTPADARKLLEGYVDSADANLNYIELIETAPVRSQTGVDAKLKLRAKRRKEQMTEEFFRTNAGINTGCEVRLSDTQDDPVKVEMDGMVATFTYGRNWLDDTLDEPSILNNFQHLFGFADLSVLLIFPAYPADLGVLERVLATAGRRAYRVGVAFHTADMISLLQTRFYHHYLASKGIDLEAVIAWFFQEYLPEEFGALNFSFTPSGGDSSYLQKARHLFAEMESVAMQFSLYAENGELDRDLLAITSDPALYKELPSLLAGKYIYAGEGEEISGILHTIFSDQSGLTYINDVLNAESTAELIIHNEVTYSDFADYQRPVVDHLITLGVLEDTGTRVQFANPEQFLILRSLFKTQACSYYHLSNRGRAEADSMVARGWMTRRSSLLTPAEASYYNYFLNKVDFDNGPELRNKYLHGSQANGEGELAHFRTYIIALRLIVALVIKMNDEFRLADEEGRARD
ncbi:hypothetical protein [Micromonospora aurantiaca (nom. illeg.)]|uniref:hypothetical protein n=1 Tax=Micromonospora aurantiaca (nom. illeg.) TaxID=47850 RepID=UPI0033FD3393